jgi:hypothetical protein
MKLGIVAPCRAGRLRVAVLLFAVELKACRGYDITWKGHAPGLTVKVKRV